MNKTFKNINEEKVLFFDLETVRNSKELDIDSKEFELFQKKIRNRENDALHSSEEVIEEYRKKAALRMCYTKIVSLGMGFIKDDNAYIKHVSGTEEHIVREFCKVASQFEYVAGANILGYDLPILCNNGMKYFDITECLPDSFIVNGKKPWDLKKVLDLMDIFKGTHFVFSNVDEMCMHFGLESPKDDLDGSMVSEEYWTNGVEKINAYVKKDVLANINLFKRMRFEPIFESFTDKSTQTLTEPTIYDNLLKELYTTKNFSKEFQTRLKKQLKAAKMKVIEKETITKLVKASYLEKIDIMSRDKKELETENKRRSELVDEFMGKYK